MGDMGHFLFSIDTELAWGFFDGLDARRFSAEGERKTIGRLLDILDEFNIRATWAVVGAMMADGYEDDNAALFEDWQEKYPAFHALVRNNSPLLYGLDILEMLRARGGRHEIAFHGFTHRLLDERYMREQEARAEIEKWLLVARRHGIAGRSVTYPRSRIGFLNLLREYGFLCYRGDTLLPGFYRLPVVGKVPRRLQYYLAAAMSPQVYDPVVSRSGLVNLPASFWLFGFNRRLERFLGRLNLDNLRFFGLVNGIKKAARQNKTIHVFAHPYEFESPQDFEKLRFVLRHVAVEVERGALRSVTMADLAEAVQDAS
jgi:hypothetical protein